METVPGAGVTPAGAGVSLPVEGMSCGGCAARLEQVLQRTAGVQAATVDFGSARATVTYDPQTTDTSALADVIRKAGFETAAPA